MGGPFDDQPAGRAGGNDLFLFDATPYSHIIRPDHETAFAGSGGTGVGHASMAGD